ncbi:hypothetical protein K6W16_00950 [Burkholderia dolosa]|jgi:hypothetical protein|uniref:Uncharacterized protein n=1 Tax=Burkholderia dolosa TaxID=152500 RepID=A0A892IEG2_9BURK|nr:MULTISPECIES: hypothetical protein [Burkholderia]AJY10742.1 hypothetical protein AK34_3543 [Burkholderia dolosa AU0158]MBR8058962.1 hypothetical protein [Burkholderia dolosa]MBR8299136.1 hypothetical protein [Burkholderia dolosa]MBR8416449.1 hypothetical protein [Burkholderia dolosa]MBR8457245.1 hypothetical protein [Burkholderia dolosa]
MAGQITGFDPPTGSNLLFDVPYQVTVHLTGFSTSDAITWTYTGTDNDLSIYPKKMIVGVDTTKVVATLQHLTEQSDLSMTFNLQNNGTDITGGNVTYNFINRFVNFPQSTGNKLYAVAPFTHVIDTTDDDQFLTLKLSVVNGSKALVGGYTLELSAESNVLFYNSDHSAPLTSNKVTTAASGTDLGTVTINVAATFAGIYRFNIGTGSGNQGQQVTVVIADPDGNGTLPLANTSPTIDNGNLDLGDAGATFTVTADANGNGASYDATTPVVIVVNGVPIVSASLPTVKDLRAGVEVSKSLLSTTASYQNRLYYMVLDDSGITGKYESQVLTFTASGTFKNQPDPSITDRPYQMPVLNSSIQVVNVGEIANGLPVSIPNDQNLLKAGDTIYVTGYASGTDVNGDPLQRTITTPPSAALKVTNSNKNNLVYYMDQFQLTGFAKGSTLYIDFYATGTSGKHYSKYRSNPWALETA